jgi:hypothetical protein
VRLASSCTCSASREERSVALCEVEAAAGHARGSSSSKTPSCRSPASWRPCSRLASPLRFSSPIQADPRICLSATRASGSRWLSVSAQRHGRGGVAPVAPLQVSCAAAAACDAFWRIFSQPWHRGAGTDYHSDSAVSAAARVALATPPGWARADEWREAYSGKQQRSRSAALRAIFLDTPEECLCPSHGDRGAGDVMFITRSLLRARR